MSNQISKTETDLNYCSDKKMPVPPTGPEAKPLPKMTLDGKIVEFVPGDTIMQAAERVGKASQIPRYCYHPGLSIAGTCRMCTVEVEKAPKLMTACSTPAADGMVVHTRSEKVLKSRSGVLDCLLANHPLDCPVCDKAGECELQDYDYEYGPRSSSFAEEKRVFPKSSTRHFSEKIVFNMNRCVACERCVRFTDEITKTNDLVMLNRGRKKELTVGDEQKGLYNDYQGCLSDFCPVGALTWTDFRFQKRVWFLRHDPSICDGCAKGCNIEVHSEKEIIYRYAPIYNAKVNGHWICDEGRLSYKMVMNPNRIIAPLVDVMGHGPVATTWEAVVPFVASTLKSSSKVLLVVGTDATQEECESLKKFLTRLSPSLEIRYFNGTGVKTSAENKPLDHLLRQSDKTPNTKGVESLGIKPLDSGAISGFDTVIVFRNGRAGIPSIASAKNVILWGVFSLEEVKALKNVKALMPGLATQEKSGTFVNSDGLAQSFNRAVVHRGFGLEVARIVEKF
ncbi:MAG: hypothetical protein A2X86_01115 [Bdellovibrionales bacterium GWA2_49_15]|nr:MAG: hypothetical protein A2X86_01115 [Bdellovibrionales bacterium GWA2_49_15]